MIPVSRSVRVAALAAALAVAVLPGVARAQGTSSDRVLAAASLPRLASDLRDAGALPAEVKMAMDEMRAAQVAPADAGRVLHAEYEARLKQRSPAVEFGVLVRNELRKGVRGPALARAITAAREAKPAPKREIR
jgi:hypothetical protein